jgi:hypothetical protein
MFLGMTLIMAAVLFDGSGSRTLSIVNFSVVAVCYGVGAVLITRDITRARLFLAHHPNRTLPARPRPRRLISRSGVEEHQR